MMTIGVNEGKFYLYVEGIKVEKSTELTVEGVIEILTEAKFQVGDTLMCSSSLDFADEYGAPADFDGREVVGHALARIEAQQFLDSCPEK